MIRALALPVLCAALAACSAEEDKAPELKPAPSPAETTAPRIVPQPSASRDPALVIQAWAGAISVKDWDAAYLYWENRGAGTGMTLNQFKAHWGRLTNPEFEIHPGLNEGAAGLLFYTAPVVLIDGERRLEGEVVLRRVNDVPGANAEDLRWHVASTTLEF